MAKHKYKLSSKVWPYPGMGGWHFLFVPKKQSEEIKKNFGVLKKGWGSIPVRVQIRKSEWETSIFPDKKSGVYLLPLKSQIRKKEDIFAEDTVSFSIEIKL